MGYLFASALTFKENCLLATHLTQRYWLGSFLKSFQFTEKGVRSILRPQAVFDAHPSPPLFKCVTLILFLRSVNQVEVRYCMKRILHDMQIKYIGQTLSCPFSTLNLKKLAFATVLYGYGRLALL